MNWPPEEGEAWVFAYGSLMWNPCFPVAESRRAILHGWSRSLCILSICNRGTPACPGLVLGLDRGGSCDGYALRIATADVPAARERLWRREMTNEVYVPRTLPVELDDGRQVCALAFVSRPDHPQYMGHLSPAGAAALVAQGVGTFGTALDYLRDTVRHLEAFGVGDGPLHDILAQAEQFEAPASEARRREER